MLLTISTTHRPATDLGFLLHKSPERLHTVDLPFGQAHVFYPEASDERATAACYLEVDAVGLVRHGRGPAHLRVDEYVNDRPYVASSLLTVALAKIYGTALNGRSKMRPELVAEPLPLEVTLSAVPVGRGVLHGPASHQEGHAVRRLFEPLGWDVELADVPLDSRFPDWGGTTSPYVQLELRGRQTVADTLRQLYVLLPVLDAAKHYWVNDEEADKLVRHGGAWLAAHPERDAVVGRYLRHQEKLVRAALEGLREKVPPEERNAVESTGAASVRGAVHDERRDTSEDDLEEPMKLNERRLEAVHNVLRELGARRVLDLGCGSGKLLQRLAADEAFQEVVGVDVAARDLKKARRQLKDAGRRVRLLQGSLTYRDRRLAGYDAAALVEVVEHVEPGRLGAFEDAVFAVARPGSVVLTTPNVEYNVLFETLVGQRGGRRLRHEDHRFEWTRREFAAWAEGVAERHGYTVRFDGIGPVDAEHGAPTQMAVFTRSS